MSTKVLMIGSAAYFAIVGVALTFLPQEINELLALPVTGVSVLMAQTLGAAFLAMAAVNWMTRTNILGGVYGKPLTLSNFLFFFVSAMAYLKSDDKVITWTLAGFSCLLAAWFGYLVFTHPFKER